MTVSLNNNGCSPGTYGDYSPVKETDANQTVMYDRKL